MYLTVRGPQRYNERMNNLRRSDAALCTRIRRRILELACASGSGHIGSALSCVELLAAVCERVFAAGAGAAAVDRDRLVLSKGHAALALYACLAEFEVLPRDVLRTFGHDGSLLGYHPAPTVPGIEMYTGSLGHGLGVAAGIAEALRLDGRSRRVYVIISDGECDTGALWEAAAIIAARQLPVTVLVDANGLQATAPCAELSPGRDLTALWSASGWQVCRSDGHDPAALRRALAAAPAAPPTALVAATVKGRGVRCMENDVAWHYRRLDAAGLARAVAELDRA